MKLDSGFRRNDDEGHIIRRLDPRICGWDERAGSNQIKSSHDDLRE